MHVPFLETCCKDVTGVRGHDFDTRGERTDYGRNVRGFWRFCRDQATKEEAVAFGRSFVPTIQEMHGKPIPTIQRVHVVVSRFRECGRGRVAAFGRLLFWGVGWVGE